MESSDLGNKVNKRLLTEWLGGRLQLYTAGFDSLASVQLKGGKYNMPTPGGNVQLYRVIVKNGRKTIEDLRHQTSLVADDIERNRKALGYKVTIKKERK